MDFLFAFAGSVLAGFLAAWLTQLRFRGTVFGRIAKHVGLGIFCLILCTSFYMLFGLNVWSISIIPVVCLIILLLIVKSAIGRLLEI